MSKTQTPASGKSKTKDDGFTLVEVLVALAIIAIMGTAVVLTLLPEVGKAGIQKAKGDIRSLDQALQMYYLDMNTYPDSLDALTAAGNTATDQRIRPGGYIKFLPKDPWGRDYLYAYPGNNGLVDIWSLGADGEPGGEGINADITSWEQ